MNKNYSIFDIFKIYILNENWTTLLFIIISGALQSSLTIIIPSLLADISTFVENLNVDKIWIGSILIILTIIFIRISVFLSSYKVVYLHNKVCYSLLRAVIKEFYNISLDRVEKYNSAYLCKRFNDDIESIITYLIQVCSSFFVNLTILILSLYFVSKINVYPGFILLIGSFLAYKIYGFLEKELVINYTSSKERSNRYFSDINRILDNYIPIKTNESLSFSMNLLDSSFNELLSSFLRKTVSVWKLNEICEFIKYISLLVTIGIYFLFKKDGSISFSVNEFVATLGYIWLFFSSLQSLVSYGKDLANAKSSLNRIKEFLFKNDSNLITNENQSLLRIDSIELKGISFSYSDSDIIKNLDYKFTKGNVYCICSANGTGKSTLIELILGLRIPQEGKILLNNKDIKKYNENTLFNLISYQSQTYSFPYQNLEDNIFWGRDDISSSQAYEILKRFNIDINSFNEKDNVENLSGGQKQKILLVHALLKPSFLLILDEPTSALDEKSVDQLLKLIDSIKEDKIIIIISHDYRIQQFSDYKVISLINEI